MIPTIPGNISHKPYCRKEHTHPLGISQRPLQKVTKVRTNATIMYHDDVAKCQKTWNGVVSRDIWTPPRVSDDQAMENLGEQLFKETEISLISQQNCQQRRRYGAATGIATNGWTAKRSREVRIRTQGRYKDLRISS